MDENEFWGIVDLARRHSGTDDRGFLDSVAASLRKMTLNEIIAFDECLMEFRRIAYRSNLWAAAYIINGGCSDDGFEYFRMWLISCGRRAFEEAIEDPATLVSHLRMERSWDAELEEFLYLPRRVYRDLAGSEMPLRDHAPVELVGEEWSEEDLPSMFPDLLRKADSRFT